MRADYGGDAMLETAIRQSDRDLLSVCLPPDALQHNCTDRDLAMRCVMTGAFPMLRGEILHSRSVHQVAMAPIVPLPKRAPLALAV